MGDDLTLRLGIAAAIVIGGLVVGVLRRRGRAVRRRSVDAAGLIPGVHLFASSSCQSCTSVRETLGELGVTWTEHHHDKDPEFFSRFRINEVPALLVVETDGHGWVAVGLARRRRLARWLGVDA